MPDISMLVEIAEFYEVDIREIIDGERKSENMNDEVKVTILAVADYADKQKNKLGIEHRQQYKQHSKPYHNDIPDHICCHDPAVHNGIRIHKGVYHSAHDRHSGGMLFLHICLQSDVL